MSDGQAAIPAMATQRKNDANQPHESKLGEVSELEKLAEHVFGDREVGIRWLREPNLATYNTSPINLLDRPSGFEQVKNLLLRIEYGVLA